MPNAQATSRGTALVTGASTGIGATYADRLAKRGYDLILVARDEARLQALAARLTAETGVKAKVVKADLTARPDLLAIEQILRDDPSITLLVNNAGMATMAAFTGSDMDVQQRMLDLNVVAPTRLAGAALPGFVARGSGAIINVSSVLAFGHDFSKGLYSATKAFVLDFSRSLKDEVGDKGIRVQAVLPAATRTEIWEKAGRSVESLPPGTVMSVDDLVDAAMVGFDRGEEVTLPSLHDEGLWRVLDQARKALMSDVGHEEPGERYGLRQQA